MSLKEKAVSSVKWSGTSTAITLTLQITQTLILAFFLSATDYGIWGILSIIFLFIRQFSDVGISSALIHFQEATIEQISTIFWISNLIGIVSFILFNAFIPLVELFYIDNISTYLFVFSFTLLFIPAGAFFQTLFQKELNFKLIAKIEIFIIFLSMLISVYIAANGYGVWALIIGNMSSLILRALFFIYSGFKNTKILICFRFNEVRHFLKFGYYQLGERLLNFISFKIDQILIGGLLGIEQLGFYNFAFNIVSKPYIVLNPIFTKVAFPILAKVQNDTQLLRRYYMRLLNSISFNLSKYF